MPYAIFERTTPLSERFNGQYRLLFGPFSTEREARAAHREYCVAVRGWESYQRYSRTWVASITAPPVAS